jgi:hypothetical protein
LKRPEKEFRSNEENRLMFRRQGKVKEAMSLHVWDDWDEEEGTNRELWLSGCILPVAQDSIDSFMCVIYLSFLSKHQLFLPVKPYSSLRNQPVLFL